MAGQYKIVKLIEPAMCLTCRFAGIATVADVDGNTMLKLHCRRFWCDNHQELDKESDMKVIATGAEVDQHQ